MKYEMSDRIQFEDYCCYGSFMCDVIETLYDESLDIDEVNIIADTYTTENIIKTICQISMEDFKFELMLAKFDKANNEVDEYEITILNDGEVFVESAIDKNAGIL